MKSLVAVAVTALVFTSVCSFTPVTYSPVTYYCGHNTDSLYAPRTFANFSGYKKSFIVWENSGFGNSERRCDKVSKIFDEVSRRLNKFCRKLNQSVICSSALKVYYSVVKISNLWHSFSEHDNLQRKNMEKLSVKENIKPHQSSLIYGVLFSNFGDSKNWIFQKLLNLFIRISIIFELSASRQKNVMANFFSEQFFSLFHRPVNI